MALGSVAWLVLLQALLPARISTHELWWFGPLALLSAWFARAPSLRVASMRLSAVALFFFVGEVATRLAGQAPNPTRWPPNLAAGPLHWQYPCRLDAIIRTPEDSLDRPRPRVIHFGDSMTQGPGPRDQTFVGLLDRADPSRSHIALALAGTGPDCALYLLRQLPTIDAIYLHLFPANDNHDIFFRYPWCHEQTLLDYDTPGLPSRCPDGPHDLPWHRRLAWDPSPYMHRDLSRVSALWHAVQRALWAPLPSWLGGLETPPERHLTLPVADKVIEALVAEADQRDVPLHATLLPWSGFRFTPEWEALVQGDAEGWRAILRRHEVPTLDLTDVLLDVTDPPVPGVYVSDAPPDPHYGPEGFRRVFEAMRTTILAEPPTQPGSIRMLGETSHRRTRIRHGSAHRPHGRSHEADHIVGDKQGAWSISARDRRSDDVPRRETSVDPEPVGPTATPTSDGPRPPDPRR